MIQSLQDVLEHTVHVPIEYSLGRSTRTQILFSVRNSTAEKRFFYGLPYLISTAITFACIGTRSL
jgi:hypothetical protein